MHKNIIKLHVDDWYRGQVAAVVVALNNIKKRDSILCIETKCIAIGSQVCEFVIKKRKEFDLKDNNIKGQVPINLKLPFDIGKKSDLKGLPKRYI